MFNSRFEPQENNIKCPYILTNVSPDIVLLCALILEQAFYKHSINMKLEYYEKTCILWQGIHELCDIIFFRVHFECELEIIFSRDRTLVAFNVGIFISDYHVFEGPSWSWSYDSWIYNYLCNQCPSPLKLWVRTPFMARCTRYNIIG